MDLNDNQKEALQELSRAGSEGMKLLARSAAGTIHPKTALVLEREGLVSITEKSPKVATLAVSKEDLDEILS